MLSASEVVSGYIIYYFFSLEEEGRGSFSGREGGREGQKNEEATEIEGREQRTFCPASIWQPKKEPTLCITLGDRARN
jgi:hypothetical protein